MRASVGGRQERRQGAKRRERPRVLPVREARVCTHAPGPACRVGERAGGGEEEQRTADRRRACNGRTRRRATQRDGCTRAAHELERTASIPQPAGRVRAHGQQCRRPTRPPSANLPHAEWAAHEWRCVRHCNHFARRHALPQRAAGSRDPAGATPTRCGGKHRPPLVALFPNRARLARGRHFVDERPCHARVSCLPSERGTGHARVRALVRARAARRARTRFRATKTVSWTPWMTKSG